MTGATPLAAAPDARTLNDFAPLLRAELIVLHAAASGGIAKVGYQRPVAPTPELRLRAEFLGFMARGGGDGAPVAGRRLQIVGACVVGRLDLAGAAVPMSLWFYRCRFDTAPLLDGMRAADSVAFADCAMPGLQASASRIDGDLALNAGCSIDGEVRLSRARLGGDLNCERMRLRGSGGAGRGLRADAALIGGDVILGGGFEAVGGVRFAGTCIGGDLRASAARITADLDDSGARGVALDLDRLRVRGSVWLDAGFSATGQVRLAQARIDADLDCSGAAFDAAGDASWGDNSPALLLDRTRVGGTLVLRQLQGPLQGASLADARAGALLDDASAWGHGHVLDGFEYTRLAPQAPVDAPMRLDWLARQHAAHVGPDFRPEPWRQVIGVLRRMGRDRSARSVAIGREHQLRRAGRIGLDAPAPLRWLVRLVHGVFGAFAGYGHRSLRLLASAVVVWLMCGGVYWAGAERRAFAPSAPLLLADPRLASCRPDCPQLPMTAPTFQPFVYSLDVLLPLLDLQQVRHWAPARDAPSGDSETRIGILPLRLLIGFETVCGWLIGLTWLAAVMGLTDRDRTR